MFPKVTPSHITFTGIDKYTSISEMLRISDSWPTEWAMLFSKAHQEVKNRYPHVVFVEEFIQYKDDLDFAAHLCGDYANQVLKSGWTEIDSLIDGVKRIQINTSKPITHEISDNIYIYSKRMGVDIILQCRQEFPTNFPEFDWLFDTSGGRGKEPEAWAKPTLSWCGFAGGINPDNVKEVVKTISSMSPTYYWLDMETGVRDENDNFSLEKCEAVCKAAYE